MAAHKGLNWHPQAFLASVGKQQEQRLDIAATALASEIKRLIRDTPKTGKMPTGSKRRATKGGYAIEHRLQRSAPGEPPAPQHGTHGLLGRVGWDRPDKYTRRVGYGESKSGKPYGFWLEFGTRRMAARPAIRPALSRMKDTIGRILRTGRP